MRISRSNIFERAAGVRVNAVESIEPKMGCQAVQVLGLCDYSRAEDRNACWNGKENGQETRYALRGSRPASALTLARFNAEGRSF